jgi:hypothetical protein
MTNLITKLLGPPEEVRGYGRFPALMHRWLIFWNQHFKVYLHHWSQADLTADLQRYPEAFISIGLAKEPAEDSGEVLGKPGGRVAWMVLIAKSPQCTSRVTGDCTPAGRGR